MPMVIVIVTAAVSTIAYLIVTLIPQLQDEQKKSQDSIDYKIFITSLNDYVVHAMREKWCVNKISYSGGILETDLLLSNDCSSSSTMEQMVTFEGNLERVLWTDDTIGQSDDEAGKNTIIGLHKVTTSPATLTPAQIKVSEMKLRLSENVLTNMNDQHPLFVITRNIRKCVEYVDIEIKRDPNSTGEEVKIGINIEAKLSDTKIACLQSVRNVSSSSHYTFFPRRLHTYSLVKYKDLEADKFHEYHGPVYVAGDLILPPSGFDKSKSSIFYDTLTLGIYNEGVSGGEYEAGKIKTNSGENYTFEERGHPYLSKQDNYENFRGLIGGLRLDASEDKGISQIFTSGSASSSDVATLEACIEDNQVKTKPSYTAGTILLYRDPVTSSGATINSIRMGLTKKNRFKPSINAPQVISASPDGVNKKFILNVTSTNGTKEIGDFKVNINSDNTFVFSTAPNSPADLSIDTAKYGLTNAILDPAITTLTATTTIDNYQTYLPAGHILLDLPEAVDYKNKAEVFKLACTAVPVSTSSDCDDFLTSNVCVPPLCVVDLSAAKNAMVTAKNTLRTKINDAKMAVATPAKIHFETNGFLKSGKEVINQKDLKIEFSSNWAAVINLIKSTLPNELTIEFKPYHYSYDDLKIIFHHNLTAPNTLTRLKRQDNGNEVSFHTSGWRNSYNNGNIPYDDQPEELTERNCPDGMSLADWNQDMSSSTNFSWNYANTPPGAEIEEATHDNLPEIKFIQKASPDEGHAKSHTKSVVDLCTVPNDREFVFGFYACKRLVIAAGRSKPLYMIGTFIVEEIENTNTSHPVHWHTVWDAKAGGLIISEYFKDKASCQTLFGKTWSQIITSASLKEDVKKCSAMDLVTNGPNNFTWTTVDPDIGLIAGNTMTSQKVLRVQRWIIREDSRADFIR